MPAPMKNTAYHSDHLDFQTAEFKHSTESGLSTLMREAFGRYTAPRRAAGGINGFVTTKRGHLYPEPTSYSSG